MTKQYFILNKTHLDQEVLGEKNKVLKITLESFNTSLLCAWNTISSIGVSGNSVLVYCCNDLTKCALSFHDLSNPNEVLCDSNFKRVVAQCPTGHSLRAMINAPEGVANISTEAYIDNSTTPFSSSATALDYFLPGAVLTAAMIMLS